MATIDLSSLPDSARVWIFGAARPLDEQQKARVAEEMRAFTDSWASHGEPVPSATEIREGQFLVVAVDEQVAAGGCSLDRLFQRVRDFRSLGADFLDASLVFYRDGAEVRAVPRPDFRRLAESGAVNASTVVYDVTAEALGDLRHGRWARPAAQSWHAGAFGLKG